MKHYLITVPVQVAVSTFDFSPINGEAVDEEVLKRSLFETADGKAAPDDKELLFVLLKSSPFRIDREGLTVTPRDPDGKDEVPLPEGVTVVNMSDPDALHNALKSALGE